MNITREQVRNIIKTQLKGRLRREYYIYPFMYKTMEPYLDDPVYDTVSMKLAQEILAASPLDRIKDKPNNPDCANFAFLLHYEFLLAALNMKKSAQFAFGFTWGLFPQGHAINWMINDDRVLRFVEPQNDKIVESDFHKLKRFDLIVG